MSPPANQSCSIFNVNDQTRIEKNVDSHTTKFVVLLSNREIFFLKLISRKKYFFILTEYYFESFVGQCSDLRFLWSPNNDTPASAEPPPMTSFGISKIDTLFYINLFIHFVMYNLPQCFWLFFLLSSLQRAPFPKFCSQ